MPTFTEEKRDRVRETLHKTGRDLFGRYGLRKTTIEELTEPADIAKGTFYQFYDSKEDLYIAIIDEYSDELIPRVMGASFEAYDDPEEAIAAFLDVVLNELETNPLIRRIIMDDEVDRLRAQYSDDDLAAERERKVAYFLPYIEQWYDDGRIIGPDPETIAYAIRAVGNIVLHEEDLGEERYHAVRDTLITAVAAGLTDESDSTANDHE